MLSSTIQIFNFLLSKQTPDLPTMRWNVSPNSKAHIKVMRVEYSDAAFVKGGGDLGKYSRMVQMVVGLAVNVRPSEV